MNEFGLIPTSLCNLVISSDDEQGLVLKGGVLQGSCDYQIKPVKMEALKSCGRTRFAKICNILERLEQPRRKEEDKLHLENACIVSCTVSGNAGHPMTLGCSLQNFGMYAENEYHYADSECSWNFNFLAIPFSSGHPMLKSSSSMLSYDDHINTPHPRREEECSRDEDPNPCSPCITTEECNSNKESNPCNPNEEVKSQAYQHSLCRDENRKQNQREQSQQLNIGSQASCYNIERATQYTREICVQPKCSIGHPSLIEDYRARGDFALHSQSLLVCNFCEIKADTMPQFILPPTLRSSASNHLIDYNTTAWQSDNDSLVRRDPIPLGSAIFLMRCFLLQGHNQD
ncbi:hypothetical protein DKX38_021253 [Salix brachista]|uniref:Uncharacterized protein n=1 Tax=Salix brachista TaxID=2182728 RepID=A0A5N5K8U7_9ROSI|nr:hypothetical protein DKX38_021253 [Salix brachista]